MRSSFRRRFARPPRRRGPPRIHYDPFFADPTVVEDDYRRMKGTG
jgi:hypothetical protein